MSALGQVVDGVFGTNAPTYQLPSDGLPQTVAADNSAQEEAARRARNRSRRTIESYIVDVTGQPSGGSGLYIP